MATATATKSKFSLPNWLGKVTEAAQAKQQRRVTDYAELVDALSTAQMTGEGDPPDAEESIAICEAAGKTAEDLRAAVDRAVMVERLREELKGESDAIDARDEMKTQITKAMQKFDEYVAAYNAKQDQRRAELRERERDVTRFAEKRRRLQSLATEPSAREVETGSEIKQLLHEEAKLKRQAGRTPLPERYVGAKVEDSSDFKQLASINAEIAGLSGEADNEHSVAAHRLRKLYPKQDELDRRVTASRKLYELGEKVQETRQRIQGLQAERSRLQAERLSSVEG